MSKRKWREGEQHISPLERPKHTTIAQNTVTHRCGHEVTYSYEAGTINPTLWTKYLCFPCQNMIGHPRRHT